MFYNQRGSTNISLLTAVIFVAIIFITGVYVGQEIKGFYRLRDLTSRWAKLAEKSKETKTTVSVTSFLECVRSGYAVQNTNPPQCQSTDGQVFRGDIDQAVAKANLIRLKNPRPYQKIISPLVVEGEARGTWFFEASFPVTITDWDGLIVGQGVAQAQGDWMTEDFVKFKATIKFDQPTVYNNGTLILKKDNPSGLAQNDDALEIPIIFQ